MLSRSATNAVATRSSSMRRQRRRNLASTTHLYCATNGCTSYLVVDEAARRAYCEICGYARRLD